MLMSASDWVPEGELPVPVRRENQHRTSDRSDAKSHRSGRKRLRLLGGRLAGAEPQGDGVALTGFNQGAGEREGVSSASPSG